jgi:hypothetical protein
VAGEGYAFWQAYIYQVIKVEQAAVAGQHHISSSSSHILHLVSELAVITLW